MTRRIIPLLILILLCVLGIPLGAVAEGQGDNLPQVVIVNPERTRFEPDAKRWQISFSLISTAAFDHEPRLVSVKLDGKDATKAITNMPDFLSVNKISKISNAELLKWNQLRKTAERLQLQNEDQRREFRNLTDLIENGVQEETGIVTLEIDPRLILEKVDTSEAYSVTYEIDTGQDRITLSTQVVLSSIASDSAWSPAELHVHTTYSDGLKGVQEVRNTYEPKGYKILYITDHVNSVQERTTWGEYSQEISDYSTSSIGLCPGTEVTTNTWDPIEARYVPTDITAYGIKNLNGIVNYGYALQQQIGYVNSNNSRVSSSSIAHPYGLTAWLSENIYPYDYSGFELMGALQVSYGDTASPMVRWRSELLRLKLNTFDSGTYMASARAGGDWHAKFYEPSPPDYVTFVRTPYWYDKPSVDSALRNGRTVASAFGGLAYMTIRNGANTYYVGDKISGVATGANLNFGITFRPVISGNYAIQIYRDNKAQLLQSYSVYLTAGVPYTPSFQHSFPGSSHYYFVQVSGEDYVYASPIFIRN